MPASVALGTAAIAIAFLLGSIPFGYVIGREFYHRDIRREGSGNIGAMNALRTMGKGGAIAVLLLDALKGFLPVFFTLLWMGPSWAALAAAASVLGHCFSPWLHWKGGKGVATAFGVVFALSWPAALCAVGAWFVGAGLTRYSSVGSMLGTAVACVALAFFTKRTELFAYGLFAALLIIYTHRENIERLRRGRENPIRLARSKSS
ncbi:MAG: glycerol-3-phosphate 1-O-acyltransferase PlsY [Candidatus Eremiobacteraeota bacterium]|nr:glycerol-3-phosphate 1-O-acyltransferase PlsY [Candidatus Eremiobacteraeota bacterium]